MFAINLIAQYVMVYNVGFAAFNLLPLPPLDGWGLISSFIPYKYNEIVPQYIAYAIHDNLLSSD